MECLTFCPGKAFLSVASPTVPWTVVFEDEGAAGYFYACDRSQQTQEASILDAMLIYNVGSMQPPDAQRLAAVEWSKDGVQAVLYLDGTAQALFDFARRIGRCRLNFPNFIAGEYDGWQRSDHSWSEDAIKQFETALYT